MRRLLNTWAETKPEKEGSSKWVSRLCLELTGRPKDVQVRPLVQSPQGDYVLTLVMKDTGLVMAEDDILVADGLLRKVSVGRGGGGQSDRGQGGAGQTGAGQDGAGSVQLRVFLEHPVVPVRDDVSGMPHTTRFTFPRDQVVEVFRDRRIGIDPGHGGKDLGFKGPVNLLEKDTSLMVAQELMGMLKASSAVPVLTRDEDISMSDAARSMLLRDEKAELCVQIHASGSDDPMEQRYGILIKEGCPKSALLGQSVADAFLERMGIRMEKTGLHAVEAGMCPTVRVEPLCLTYFSDEANFRAPLFRKRTAQAIFNGIHRFLRRK